MRGAVLARKVLDFITSVVMTSKFAIFANK